MLRTKQTARKTTGGRPPSRTKQTARKTTGGSPPSRVPSQPPERSTPASLLPNDMNQRFPRLNCDQCGRLATWDVVRGTKNFGRYYAACSGGDNSRNAKFHFFRFLDDLPEFNPRTTRPARASPPPQKEQETQSCAYPGCKSGRVATKCERPEGAMCAAHCRAQGGCNLYAHRNTLPPSTSSNVGQVTRVTYTVEIEEPSKKKKPRAK